MPVFLGFVEEGTFSWADFVSVDRRAWQYKVADFDSVDRRDWQYQVWIQHGTVLTDRYSTLADKCLLRVRSWPTVAGPDITWIETHWLTKITMVDKKNKMVEDPRWSGIQWLDKTCLLLP